MVVVLLLVGVLHFRDWSISRQLNSRLPFTPGMTKVEVEAYLGSGPLREPGWDDDGNRYVSYLVTVRCLGLSRSRFVGVVYDADFKLVRWRYIENSKFFG